MKKKIYITPETSQFTVSLQQMIAFSGESTNAEDPKVDSEADDSDEPGRSRRTYNCWEDEVEEEWEE